MSNPIRNACAALCLLMATLAPSAQAQDTALPGEVRELLNSFTVRLAAGDAQGAFEQFYASHPNPANWQSQAFKIVPQLEQIPQGGRVLGHHVVGSTMFGPKLMRLNFLIDIDYSAYAFTIILYNFGGTWIMEDFCFIGDLRAATDGGPGQLLCQI